MSETGREGSLGACFVAIDVIVLVEGAGVPSGRALVGIFMVFVLRCVHKEFEYTGGNGMWNKI